MGDLKQTLTQLVRYLDSVHKKALPTARPDASSTTQVIRYARTSQEIGEKRMSADAHRVLACKYLGAIDVRTGSALIEGKLKQAVVAARRNKRRGGNNAKWAQEFFGNLKRLGGIALREESEDGDAQEADALSSSDADLDEPAWTDRGALTFDTNRKGQAVEPEQEATPIDESQWGNGAGSWDDDEEEGAAVQVESGGVDWEETDW